MAVIQAIPGAGKSTLASTLRLGSFIDTDDLIAELGYRGRFDQLLSDQGAADRFFSSVREYDSYGRNIVTNLWFGQYRMEPADILFAYRPDEYVRHLRLSGRTDLLEQFSEETLRSWAEDYVGEPNVVWLRPGEWLGTYIGKPLLDELFSRWLRRRSRPSFGV